MAGNSFTMRLPPEIERALDAKAKATGENRSAIALRGLRQVLGLDEPGLVAGSPEPGGLLHTVLSRLEVIEDKVQQVNQLETTLGRLRDRLDELGTNPPAAVPSRPAALPSPPPPPTRPASPVQVTPPRAPRTARQDARLDARPVLGVDEEGYVGTREVYESLLAPPWGSYDVFKTRIAKVPSILTELGYEPDEERKRRKKNWLRPIPDGPAVIASPEENREAVRCEQRPVHGADADGYVSTQDVYDSLVEPPWPYDAFKLRIGRTPFLLAELGYEADEGRKARRKNWLRPRPGGPARLVAAGDHGAGT